MCDIFILRSEQIYNARQSSQFFIPKVNSAYHGTVSVSFLGPKIWDLIPSELKGNSSLAAFNNSKKECHQRNALAFFAKCMSVMLDLLGKRAR